MQYTLYVEPTNGDAIREYNGQPIDYPSVSGLPQWEGRYDEIEFLLLSMLGHDSNRTHDYEVYSPDYATNYSAVRMEFLEDEFPGFIFFTHDGRVVPVQYKNPVYSPLVGSFNLRDSTRRVMFYFPFMNVSDFLEYLQAVNIEMQSPTAVYSDHQTARPAEEYPIGHNCRYRIGHLSPLGYEK